MSPIRFGVLGPLEVERDSQPVSIGGGRQRALLVALLAHANRTVSADQLAEFVWADAPPPAAAATLQSYVSQLRRVLEPDRSKPTVIVTRPTGYQLCVEPDALDALLFEAELRAAREAIAQGCTSEAIAAIERALALWRGDPLADVCYADFAQPERTRLLELRLAAEEDRASLLLDGGQHVGAIPDLEHLVRRSPLRERARALLMLALYRAGRQADALRCYQDARHVMAEELGLDPGPDLQALEARILAADPALLPAAPTAAHEAPSALPVSASAATMVGRTSELAASFGALDDARAGAGGLLVVTGEAGIGKSTLLDRIQQRAGESGFAVAVGRCDLVTSNVALWPWMELMRELADQLGTDRVRAATEATHADISPLLPELSPAQTPAVDAEAAMHRLFDSLVRVLRHLGTQQPLLVAIEDLHWGDVTSVQLLSYAARRINRHPVLIVVTYRDTDVAADAPLHGGMAQLSRDARLRLELGPLATSEVTSLLERVLPPSIDADSLASVRERSGGNPLFVIELARTLELRDAQSLPTTLRDVLLQRIGALPPSVVDSLRMCAFAPVDIWPDHIASFLHRPRNALVDDLEAAGRAGVVAERRDEVGTWTFSHPLFREALLSDMSQLRRAEMHAQLGDFGAAELQRGVPGRLASRLEASVAEHYMQAAPVGRAELAIEWARRAASRALQHHAAASAAAILQRAVEVADTYCGVDEELQLDLSIELGGAHRAAGALDTARTVLIDAARQAMQCGDDERLATAALGIGGGSMWGWWRVYGETDSEVVDLVRVALGRSNAPSTRARLLARLAIETYFEATASELDDLTSEALACASGDEQARAEILAIRHVVIWSPTTLDERIEIARSLAGLGGDSFRNERFVGSHFLAMDLLERGDRAGAERAFGAVEAEAADLARPSSDVQVLWTKSMRCALDGDLDKADALANEALQASEHMENTLSIMVYGGTIAYVRMLQGRLVEIHELIETAIATMPSVRDGFSGALVCSLVEQDRVDEAHAVFGTLVADDCALVKRKLLEPIVLAMLAEVAPFLPITSEQGSALLDRLAPYAGHTITFAPGQFCRGAADAHIGMVHLALGDHTAAVASLEPALALNDAIDAAPASAWNRYFLSAALAGSGGQSTRARSLLGEAVAAAGAIGMAHLERRARLLLDDLG